MSATTAEARSLNPSDESGGWWVFWQTDSAYGARGLNLSKAGAEHLAARIREDGPNAIPVRHESEDA